MQGVLKVWSMTPSAISSSKPRSFEILPDANGVSPDMLSLIFHLNIENFTELTFQTGIERYVH